MKDQNMIICSSCGGQNDNKNKFCSYCGISIASEQQMNTPQQQYNTMYQQSNTTQKQYNTMNQNINNLQQSIVEDETEKKLGFLGWTAIIVISISSILSGPFALIIFWALIYAGYKNPKTKKFTIVALRVLGTMHLAFGSIIFVILGLFTGIFF